MKILDAIELGIGGSGKVYHNLTYPQLVEIALKNGEGVLSDTGALVVNTGKYTGRSPDDKYIVDTPVSYTHLGRSGAAYFKEKRSIEPYA